MLQQKIIHNDLESLDRILSHAKDSYRTNMVIVDGLYFQDGDIAKLKDILEITHKHGGVLFVDDAHGIEVIRERSRGALEYFDVLGKVDIITGTFSKTFGNVDGYLVANNPELISYL